MDCKYEAGEVGTLRECGCAECESARAELEYEARCESADVGREEWEPSVSVPGPLRDHGPDYWQNDAGEWRCG